MRTFLDRLPTPVWNTAAAATAAAAAIITPPVDPIIAVDPVPPIEPAPAADPTPPVDPAAPPTSLLSDPPPVDPTPPIEPVPPVEPLTADQIKVPKGREIDPAALDTFVTFMNNAELTPTERAQGLVDMQLDLVKQTQEANQTAWNNTITKWQAEAQAIPEIGGEKLNETLADIKAGLRKLGATPETFAALDLTGAGNHPEIIRILHKATVHLKEAVPTPAGNPPAGNLSQAERLFPNMNKE